MSDSQETFNMDDLPSETSITITNWDDAVIWEKWDEMSLKDELRRGIVAKFRRPTPVQSRAIGSIVTKRDCIIQAQSGTGKTLAFSIGVMQLLDFSLKQCQAIILAPTRELAEQIYCDIFGIANHTGINIALCIGGVDIETQRQEIKAGAQIVVGTLGRLTALQHHKTLNFELASTVVVDEGDRCLAGKNKASFRDFISCFSQSTQVIIASATFTSDVLAITNRFMNDPIRILVMEENVNIEAIQQYMVECDCDTSKTDELKLLYSTEAVGSSIIFCNKRERCQMVLETMQDGNLSAAVLTGEMEQEKRMEVMSEFKANAIRTLVTTDLCARGIDVKNLELVINFDFPDDPETYIHRVGRAGRLGRRGMAVSFVTAADRRMLKLIEDTYRVSVKWWHER